MAAIARKHQKIFALSATNNGVFGSAQVGTKVLSQNLDTLQGLAAFDTGWVDAVLSGQKLPTLEEMQALTYICTYQLAYIFQDGIPLYDATTNYFQTSIVRQSATYKLYGSLTNDNLGNALTDGTKWVFLIDLSAKADVAEVDVASASTCPIFAAASNNIRITGTTGITAFDSSSDNVGITKRVRMAASLTFTYNATSMILPGGKDLIVEAGDELFVTSLGGSNSLVRFAQRFDGSEINERKSADVASGSTCNVFATNCRYSRISGTTTITAFDTIRAGRWAIVTFLASLQLTASSNLLMPLNGGNIITEANDRAIIMSEGSGVTRIIGFIRADGSPINQVKGTDIAAGTTVDLSTATGDFVDVTGSAATIGSFGVARAGKRITTRFNQQNTLTYSSAIITPNRADFKTLSGDIATWVSLGAGNWACESYMDVPFKSSQITPASGQTDFAHGFGMTPAHASVSLVNISTEGNYSLADYAILPQAANLGGDNPDTGTGITKNAANITLSVEAITGWVIVNKSTGDSFIIDPSKWKFVCEASRL